MKGRVLAVHTNRTWEKNFAVPCVATCYELLIVHCCGMSACNKVNYYYYIRQVNRVKLAEIMFLLLCVCVRLCALSPIGVNGRNDVLYLTRA